MHALKSVRSRRDDNTSAEALHQVLVHLSGPDGDEQVYNNAARGLHLTSKQHQASARGTLRHLRLDRYHKGLLSSHGFNSDRSAADAWDMQLLQAYPEVTAWTLHPAQLERFQGGLDEVAAAAAGQLTRLEVRGLEFAHEAQVQGLGRLLWAASQLQEVDLTPHSTLASPVYPASKPWLLLDPNSTNLSTAKAPPLPLRSWTSQGVPDTLLAHWAEQQQQQLGSTLSHVSLTGAGAGGDASAADRMAALKGLKELTLDGTWPDPPKVPSSISRLTKLQLLGPPADEGALEAVCAHTTLQHLSLPGAAVEELPDTLAALKQLTGLVLTGSTISKLPEKLGVWLPRLERLEAGKCKVATVPTTLTSLTHLDMSSSTAARLTLPTTLTTLKQLVISQGAFKRMPKCISGLTALEHLDVSFCKALTSLSILQPLTRLRHLNLKDVTQCQPASYTVLGALQQLTYLGLQACPAPACAALADSQPLVALQKLQMCCLGPSSVSALGPWLSQLTALTWLSMAGSRIGVKEQLLSLPAQLQEVALYDMYLSRLPSGISQLQGLQVLHCGRNSGLRLLPAWLSQLHRLETLDLHGTEVSTEQEVLAHMPALRCVRVSPWNATRVYGGAAHLHFGHSSRLMRETWSHKA